ncbi:nitroreductase family protein [Patescibacteria group bacterium]
MPNKYPKKETPLDHDVDPFLTKRWSPLAFSDEPIEQKKIDSFFEAARWAPSSFNEQPWRYVYATKENTKQFDTLASLLSEGNVWAKEAFMLMVITAKQNFDYNDRPNKHHQYDTGAATENLFLQAVSMDLIAHEMAGFDSDKAHKILRIPDNVSVIAMMAIGYPGNNKDLDSELLEREEAERKRRKVKTFAYKGIWSE